MQQLLEGLYTWSVFNEEKQLPFNGHFAQAAERFILVDPPPMSAEQIQLVESIGIPNRIYLTNKHHTRAAAEHRARWGAKLYIHQDDAPLMEIPVDGTFSDGEILLDEGEAIRIPDAKTPGECAFYWKKRGVLIVGDAILGKPQGGLSLLPDAKFKDPKAARLGLSVLRGLEYDTLLVGDGWSILKDARPIVEAFINSIQ